MEYVEEPPRGGSGFWLFPVAFLGLGSWWVWTYHRWWVQLAAIVGLCCIPVALLIYSARRPAPEVVEIEDLWSDGSWIDPSPLSESDRLRDRVDDLEREVQELKEKVEELESERDPWV